MTENLKRAIALLDGSDLTLVYIKNGEPHLCRERGVAPLLFILDTGEDMKGACFADKVVGKGAAFIYILLGVDELYARVISTPARELLEKNGVSIYFDTEVPAIKNRKGDGYCPIESAVLSESCPERAEKKIRSRISELKSAHGGNKKTNNGK